MMWIRSFILCSLFMSSQLFALDSTVDRKGVKYHHITKNTPLSIHVIEIDPNLFRMEIVRALNNGIGREPVLCMAQRHGAFGAINAGLYRVGGAFDGLPQGILKIDNRWYSLPDKERGAIGWNKGNTRILIDRLKSNWKIYIDGKQYPLDGLNIPRRSEKAILYSWAFHRSTLTNSGGTEVIIQNGRIVDVNTQYNDNSIPSEGYVYSVGPDVPIDRNHLKIGAQVKIDKEIIPSGTKEHEKVQLWQQMDYIVGGAPILLREGKIPQDFTSEHLQESFLTMPYPRTAIGVKNDGTIVCVIVDGRQAAVSKGMTITELAAFMQQLGCVDALNLDGGTSSILIWGGKAINSPLADKQEAIDCGGMRRVSDAILFFPKRYPYPER